MSVFVVNVGKVCVTMAERRMVMLVRMRLYSIPIFAVFVLMVLIVPMCMRVGQRLVDVFVLMMFRHMQPDAKGH